MEVVVITLYGRRQLSHTASGVPCIRHESTQPMPIADFRRNLGLLYVSCAISLSACAAMLFSSAHYCDMLVYINVSTTSL